MNGVIRLARAELRKLFTTRALPVSFAIAIVLAIGSVIIDAMVAGKNGSPRLGTDAAVHQMLKFGAITCVVMLILGILAAGRNTIGAIGAAIAWTLFVEQVILAAIVPGIEKWLPTGAAIGLTNAPGSGPAHSLPAAVAGVVLAGTVLAGYGIVMLPAASRTTIRRDVV